MTKTDNYWKESTPLQAQINITFDAYCSKCNVDFLNISHDYDCDFLAWVDLETDSARRHGWTDDKKSETVLCPVCSSNTEFCTVPRTKPKQTLWHAPQNSSFWKRLFGKF